MASSSSAEAFLLLTLPLASLRTRTLNYTGTLAVEYVTFSLPPSAHLSPETPDVFLILRLGDYDTVIDPTRTITHSESGGQHRYVFHGTQADGEIVLNLPSAREKGGGEAGDLETFHSILEEYGDYRGPSSEHTVLTDVESSDVPVSTPGAVASSNGDEDLRGRFVLMNEYNGQIIGALDNTIHVQEDPSLREKGHEDDPVVVELPEDADNVEQLSESQVLVRTVPPEERDWMFKGAIMASHVISGGTALLTTAMTSASNYYVAHTKPGQHQQPSASSEGSNDPDAPGTKPTTMSRTFLFLSSPTTREHLTRIHAMSGQAVELSGKTAAAVDGLIQRVVGGSNTKSFTDANATQSKSSAMGGLTARAAGGVASPSTTPGRPSAASEKPPLPARKMGGGAPSPYSPNLSANNLNILSEKPPLPSRKPATSPSSASTSGYIVPVHEEPPPLPDRGKDKSKKWGGVALSAALILSALSESSTRLVDAGGIALSNAVTHKYGERAGDNARMAAGTVRNVALVYVDVRGFGRKAIVKKVAGGYMKGKINNRKQEYLKDKEKAD